MTHGDGRLRAFLSEEAPAVFHSVAHRHDVWREDPFDVESIHGAARDVFERLLHAASTPPGPRPGSIVLIKGEAGSGKTHLMRAFRSVTHGRSLGYVTYMQMTSNVTHYARYILAHTVASLDQAYAPGYSDRTGWMRLSSSVAERSDLVPEAHLPLLREQSGAKSLAKLVSTVSGRVLSALGRSDLDIDILRALLYLQHEHPLVRSATLRWLRCEDLSASDREAVGALIPRIHDDDPQRQLESIGRWIEALGGGSLVIAVDQLEDVYTGEPEAKERARRSLETVCRLHERIPSSIFIIACLEDLWEALRPFFTRSVLDRVEHDPDPVRLDASLGEEQILEVVGSRLAHLYEVMGVEWVDGEPVYPFTESELRALAGLRVRDVLDACRRAREGAMATGTKPHVSAAGAKPRLAFPVGPVGNDDALSDDRSGPDPLAAPEVDVEMETRWSDLQVTGGGEVPRQEADRAELLAWALESMAVELPEGVDISARSNGTMIEIEVALPDGSESQMLLGLCEKSARGGALARQIDEVSRLAGARISLLARSTEFPSNPKTQIATRLGEFVRDGGRRVVVEDSDWRTMDVLRQFLDGEPEKLRVARWRRSEHPLVRLHSLSELLDVDGITERALAQSRARGDSDERSPKSSPTPRRPDPNAVSPDRGQPVSDADTGGLVLGTTLGITAESFRLELDSFVRHAAFLGSSGSGKTTLALAVLEQVLDRGVPVIAVDRKGDLVSWCEDGALTTELDDERDGLRERLADRVEVALYTPGELSGRPLSMPVVPAGLGSLSPVERDRAALEVAENIGGMLGYKPRSQADKTRTTILARAIGTLAEKRPDQDATVDEVIRLLDDKDPALLQAIGKLDPKKISPLVEHLETFRFQHGMLIGSSEDTLDIEEMLRVSVDAHGPRGKLSVISTKFLGGNDAIVFWVAQLLCELERHATRHPADGLQAIVLFDEADLYLPAQGKPATKPRMENALKRFRSAGIGIFLATQSPGDLDYKCRDNIGTWFVGQVKEKTALQKMKPMLGDCRSGIESQIPGQSVGEFRVIQRGVVTPIRAARSVVSPEQVGEGRIIELAAALRPSLTPGS